jgi:hypothetical protein
MRTVLSVSLPADIAAQLAAVGRAIFRHDAIYQSLFNQKIRKLC